MAITDTGIQGYKITSSDLNESIPEHITEFLISCSCLDDLSVIHVYICMFSAHVNIKYMVD